MHVATYAYNDRAQRIEKITAEGTTLYHYDLQGNLLTETRPDGTLIRTYVYLPLPDGKTLPFAQIEYSNGKKLTYLHTDHLHTPRLGTNTKANVVWRWEGEAFGQTVPNEDVDRNGIATTVNLRYPGQYYDSETGRMQQTRMSTITPHAVETGPSLTAGQMGLMNAS